MPAAFRALRNWRAARSAGRSSGSRRDPGVIEGRENLPSVHALVRSTPRSRSTPRLRRRSTGARQQRREVGQAAAHRDRALPDGDDVGGRRPLAVQGRCAARPACAPTASAVPTCFDARPPTAATTAMCSASPAPSASPTGCARRDPDHARRRRNPLAHRQGRRVARERAEKRTSPATKPEAAKAEKRSPANEPDEEARREEARRSETRCSRDERRRNVEAKKPLRRAIRRHEDSAATPGALLRRTRMSSFAFGASAFVDVLRPSARSTSAQFHQGNVGVSRSATCSAAFRLGAQARPTRAEGSLVRQPTQGPRRRVRRRPGDPRLLPRDRTPRAQRCFGPAF